MSRNPKYVVRAALTSFIMPIATIVWFFSTYSFRNPDGSIDNGPIRGAPFIALLLLFVFVVQLFVYGSLGRRLYQSNKPSLIWCVVYATAFSLPFPIFVLCMDGLDALAPTEAMLPAVATFMYAWVCFLAGAVLQLLLINRQGQVVKRTP